MIPAALVAALVQVSVPGSAGLSVDQRIAVVAGQEARSTLRISTAVYEDPALRAELRRVGFGTGCRIVRNAGSEVAARHAAALAPRAAEALRAVVPADRWEEARALSFLAMPLAAYRNRFEEALERTAAPALAAARADMRRTFLQRTRTRPTERDPAANRVAPRPDVAAALGRGRDWDLDNPAQLQFACAEHLISPANRPTITTGESR